MTFFTNSRCQNLLFLLLLFIGTTFSIPCHGTELLPSETAEDPYDPALIFISEFMANPKAVSDSNGEWLEIYNANTQAVNLNNWIIQTQSSTHIISDPELLIDAQDYLVLCKKNDPLLNGGISCNYQYSGLSLTNTTGSLAFTAPEQTPVFFNYSKALASEGKSAEFEISLPQLEYYQETSWHLSQNLLASGDFGTPGIINSVLALSSKTETSSPPTSTGAESTEASTEAVSSFIEINSLTELADLPTKTAVHLSGIITSPAGIPEETAFYLQNDNQGILIKTGFDFYPVIGEALEIKGEFRRTKQYNYIKIETESEINLLGAKSLDLLNFSKCLEKNNCGKWNNALLEFEGVFQKKNGNYIYLLNENNLLAKIKIPNKFSSIIENFSLNSWLKVQGILINNTIPYLLLTQESQLEDIAPTELSAKKQTFLNNSINSENKTTNKTPILKNSLSSEKQPSPKKQTINAKPESNQNLSSLAQPQAIIKNKQPLGVNLSNQPILPDFQNSLKEKSKASFSRILNLLASLTI